MTDLKEHILTIGNRFGITDPDFMLNVSRLLVNNNWYGCQPVQTNGKLMLSDEGIQKIEKEISVYCNLYYSDEKEKSEYLIE